MQLQSYRYYDPKTCGFDFTGAVEDISVSGFLGRRGEGTRNTPPGGELTPPPPLRPVSIPDSKYWG